MFENMNPLQNPYSALFIAGSAYILYDFIVPSVYRQLGLHRDATKTEVKQDMTIYIDDNKHGPCKKMAEMETGESRFRGDGTKENKILLEYIDDTNVIHHQTIWEDELQMDKNTRNGLEFQIHRVVPKQAIKDEHYRNAMDMNTMLVQCMENLTVSHETEMKRVGKRAGQFKKDAGYSMPMNFGNKRPGYQQDMGGEGNE